MHILLTGGTGLIGQALCRHWKAKGHTLTVWSRSPAQVPALCSGAHGIAQLQALQGLAPLDAVVNLAGAPIADRPWTQARRQVLWQSRVALTRQLLDGLRLLPQPPSVLLSGSAVGWYGNRGDDLLDETSHPGPADFGSKLCAAWEQEAATAQALGMRVVALRIAPVLAPTGGMLGKLRLPFSLGLGGHLGSGQQWMPWIHLDDMVGVMDFLLLQHDAAGAFNACAPQAVRNAEFTQALASALSRPALLPAPAWALRLALGDMSVLLLGGQRLAPTRLQTAGYRFQHPLLAPALKHLLSTKPSH